MRYRFQDVAVGPALIGHHDELSLLDEATDRVAPMRLTRLPSSTGCLAARTGGGHE